MKKTVTGLLLSMMILLGISLAGNITVENKSSTSSCNSSETVNKYLYLSPGEYTVSDKPWDTFYNTVDSLIKAKNGETSVQIWRNGVIVDCNDWNTSSIVVSSADTDGASIIVNKDGCDFNKPSYTKTSNPTAIDAQIHYTIGYARIWEGGSLPYTKKLYHKNYEDTEWTCYPGGNKVTNNQECPNVNIKYVDETRYHTGECINYRVFRCGDGLVNRPGSVSYDNGYHYEPCDPESPEWKNRADGKTCSETCEIIEPAKEDPVCSSTYNNKTKYTETSAVWLSSNDDLCSKGTVKNFNYSGEPRTFTWDCENDGTTTGCTAKQEWCGDGEKNGTEECDPNDGSETNWGNDGCSLSCQQKNEVVSVCDEENTFYRKLRYLSGYIFEDYFSAGSADRRLYGNPDVKFEEKMDYNRGPNPTFNWSTRLVNNDMKVSGGDKKLVVESTPEYVIKDHPAVREKDNLYIEYTLKYANKKYATTPDESKLKTHKECVYYEISRCGDGILDTENGEECDPGSTGTSVLPDGRICNSDCKIEDSPLDGKLKVEKTLMSESKYVKEVGQEMVWQIKVTAEGGDVENVRIKDYLPEVLTYISYTKDLPSGVTMNAGQPTSGTDSTGYYIQWQTSGTLKEGKSIILVVTTKVNKMPKTTDNYDNVACAWAEGMDENCDKKPIETGKLKVEKTLKNKIIVTRTGEILTWKVRVTAEGGDITDFKVKDLLPIVLKYNGYDVTSNEDNLKVNDPTGPVVAGNNNVYTRDVEGTLKKDHVLEIEIETEVIKMPKAGDDNRNVACVVKDDTEDCDPEDIPYLWIKKTFSDGSKEVKTVKIGDRIAYKISFGNSGQVNATVTSIKDFLPKNVAYESSTISINGYDHGDIEIGNGVIEKSQEKREGVEIDTFGGITLKPGDVGYIILTGVIKGEFTGDRTNFACIYLNDKQIDCDDVKHDIDKDTGLSCKPTLNPSSFGDVSCSDTSSFTTTVTCSSTGGKADLEILCDGSIVKTGYDEKITGTCTGTANNTDYKVQCKINGSLTGANGESCEGSFRRNCSNPGSSCFVAGTKVTMCDKSEKNIELVEIGECLLGENDTHNIVKGYDRPQLGERELRSINGSKYFVSDEHPFKTTEGWKAFDQVMARKEIANALANGWLVNDEQTEDLLNISELKLGDILIKKNGGTETVVSLSSVTRDPNTQLYNFVLSGNNTYYADGYLVHNKGGGGGGGTSPKCDSLEPEDGKMVCRSDKNAYITMFCDKDFKVAQLTDEKGKVLKYSDYSDCEKIECYVSDTKYNGRNGSKCVRENNNPVEEGTQLCMNVNAGNFSIEEGEIFPFYWNLRNMKGVYKKLDSYTEMEGKNYNAISNYEKGGECDSDDEGKIAKNSMVCTFNIYDGNVYTKGPGKTNPLYTIEGPCLSKNSVINSNKLISGWYYEMRNRYCSNESDCEFYFGTNSNSSILPTAVYYIQKFGTGATVHLNAGNREAEWSLGGKDESQKSYGEYKIELSNIRYLQCEKSNDKYQWEKKESSKNFDFVPCQNNFMLTNSYTVQKTPSGNVTASTKELAKYRYYGGNSTFTGLLNAIQATDYKPNGEVENAMDNFINKYKKLAVKVTLSTDSFLSGTNVSKVPGKDIYFVDGPIKIKGGSQNIKKAFTIVQTSGSTTIEGNIGHNMMLLTKKDIMFEGNCKTDQEVKGIFYAKGNLSRGGTVRKNTDPTIGTWCTNGGLHVKGVLIGNNFNNLMSESRSNINGWFTVKGSEQEILNQRRRYVMNGASVVIEYSPSIFTKSTMPPGAEDFTTALSIYKN